MITANYTKNDVFSLCDMESVLEMVPTLEYTTWSEIKELIDLVVSYGYPLENIPELVCVNPTFLALNKATLKQELDAIEGDIELALNENPYLI